MKSYKEIKQTLIEKGFRQISSLIIKSTVIDRFEYWLKGENNGLMIEVWKNEKCIIFKEVETI